MSAAKDHLPNLDGLRTLAAFTVVFGHCHAVCAFPINPDSSLQGLKHLLFDQAVRGVEFFFVLSGFLITRIVLREQDGPAGFQLRLFWMRRILRIWPVYFLVTAVGGLAAATGWPAVAMPHNQWALILTFLENFDLLQLIQQGLPYGLIVSVLWSVSIEEQFYLFYPLLLVLVPRRFYLPLFLAIVLASLRFKMLASGPAVGFHTFSRCYELGIGCVLALLWPRPPEWAGKIPSWLSLLPYGLCLLLVLGPGSPYWLPWLFAWIVFDQAYCQRSWLQTRRVPLLNALGKITYGIYSYHVIFALAVYHAMRWHGIPPHTLGTFAFYVAAVSLLVVGFSLASYRWMERPLLRWKERMRPV